jgi:protein-S-isoprenylcysteine O-methyltransferase Ste14
MSERAFSWRDQVPAILSSVLFLSQMAVGAYLLSWVSQIEVLAYVGVGLYVFSGLVLGCLPIIEFRRRGGVGKGESYIHTTKLVDTGIYSVVRHPQYDIFSVGNYGYAAFPTLDCYPAWISYFPVDIH